MAGYLRIVRKDTELFYHVEGVKKATNFPSVNIATWDLSDGNQK
jgi:hypothetical protein